MYAMLIPSLLMGNVVVMKLPNIGGLAHILSAKAFAQAFPPGVSAQPGLRRKQLDFFTSWYHALKLSLPMVYNSLL